MHPMARELENKKAGARAGGGVADEGCGQKKAQVAGRDLGGVGEGGVAG
jgi:hypothetical protein